MCCRYYIERNVPELEAIVDSAMKSPLMERFAKAHPAPLVRFGEVAPTNLVAAIASDKQRNATVFPMTWGFSVPGRSAPMANARVETAAEKPTFRDSWKSHRCTVPASWYYEWQHLPKEDGRSTTSTKYAIQPKDTTVTYLCGLYRIENGLPVFVILTREPSPDISHIHDRMPLILPQEAICDWVNPAVKPEDILPYALSAMAAEKAG